jgi:hypothetical protein
MVASSYLRLGVLLVTIHVMAAYETGSIVGRVVDPKGIYLAYPEVQVFGAALAGATTKLVGDRQGHFWLVRLEPGAYTVTISVRGFKKAVTDAYRTGAKVGHRRDAIAGRRL